MNVINKKKCMSIATAVQTFGLEVASTATTKMMSTTRREQHSPAIRRWWSEERSFLEWTDRVMNIRNEEWSFLEQVETWMWRARHALFTVISGVWYRAVCDCPQGLFRVLIMLIMTGFAALRGGTGALSARYWRCYSDVEKASTLEE